MTQRTLSDFYGFHILKELLWQDKVESVYDPSGGLPLSPDFRDRYIAGSTANGWTENHIYEWDTEGWFETIPTWGFITLVLDEHKYYFYNGSDWLLFDTIIDHNELTNTHQEVYTTSTPSFDKVTITGTLDTETDAVTKTYVDSIVQGLNWQDGVISFYDPSTGLPSSPTDDDRYIASATANGWTKDNIYWRHLSSWVEIVVEEGFVAWVEDEDRKYVYSGGWVVFGETVTHDNLIGVNPATATYMGHVKVGDGLLVDADGTIHYDPPDPIEWTAGNKSYIGDHSGSTITVPHNMNVEYVYVQCITRVDKKVLFPDVIQTLDNNNVYLEFSESVDITVLIREITGSAGWVEWDISQDHQGVDIHEDNITSLSVTQHEGDIDHDQLTNYVVNEHIDHSSVSILTSGIVSGGGDLTASRTITLNHSDVDHDQTTNFLATEHRQWENSITQNIHANNITSLSITQHEGDINHDQLTNFVPNEHIDHTTVSISTNAPLTGGGDISTNRTLDISLDSTDLGIDGSNQLYVKDAGIDHDSTTNVHQDVTTSASPSFVGVTITGSITNGTDAASKDYVDGLVQGLDWSESVIDRYDPSSGLPGTPTDGDRYLSTATANGWTENYIYEYDGLSSIWTEIIPDEGFAIWVEDEDVQYVYNGTIWTRLASIYQHSSLSGLQGGAPSEYYHLDATEFGYLNGQDQAVASTSSPTFTDLTISTPSLIYNLDHDSFSGFVPNEHINHSGVNITAGTGLSGGGDITASRTINLNAVIGDLNNVNISTPAAGQLLIYNATNTEFVNAGVIAGTGISKIEADGSLTISTDDANINHDALNNFVPNEHINHTSVSISSGTGLSGGGDITASRTISLNANINDLNDVSAGTPTNDYVLTWNNTLGYWEPREVDTIASDAPVDSVFGRIGAVTATAGDYSASQVTNDSTITGTYVDDALNNLDGHDNTYHSDIDQALLTTSDVTFGSTSYGDYKIEYNSTENSLDFVYTGV